MNPARNRDMSLAAGVAIFMACAAGLTAAACGVDGTTPECASPDSGCDVATDASVTTAPGDSATSDAPSDVSHDVAVDAARDAAADAADARPRDARADG